MSFSDHIKDRELNKFSIRNGRRVVNVDSPAVSQTPYGEAISVQRSVLFESKANVPSVSKLRNRIIKTPVESESGVSLVGGEFEINCLPGSEIVFETGERGRYKPGYQAQAGIGFRLSNMELTGDSLVEWGYFNGTDGIGYGKDSLGVYVFLNSNDTKQIFRQQDWNTDKLDGSGRSQYDLDLSDGLIFQIDFNWYGYGAINFTVVIKSEDPTIGDYSQIIHRIAPKGSVSTEQPNLFISTRIKNDQSDPMKAYVGGRQFSIYGKNNPQFRSTSDFRLNRTVGTTFLPLVSFRRKSENVNQLAQAIKIRSAELAPEGDIIFGYIFDGELTGATFGTPTGIDANETVLESDIAANEISGGVFVGPKNLGVGGSNNRAVLTKNDDFTFDLIGAKIITLVARSVSGNVAIGASIFNVTEEW